MVVELKRQNKRKKQKSVEKKNKSRKVKVQFREEHSGSGDDEKRFGELLSDQGRKEELDRLLELAKRKAPRSARGNRSGSRSARLPSTHKSQFDSLHYSAAPQTARPWKKTDVPNSADFSQRDSMPRRVQSARADIALDVSASSSQRHFSFMLSSPL